jgi:hypothetical protein
MPFRYRIKSRPEFRTDDPNLGAGSMCDHDDIAWKDTGIWFIDDDGTRCWKPRASHVEWQRVARFRDQLLTLRTTLAAAMVLLENAATTYHTAFAILEEDGSPPVAFDEARFFKSLWEGFAYDIGFAAANVHGDVDPDVCIINDLSEVIEELDDLTARCAKACDFSVKCERLTRRPSFERRK